MPLQQSTENDLPGRAIHEEPSRCLSVERKSMGCGEKPFEMTMITYGTVNGSQGLEKNQLSGILKKGGMECTSEIYGIGTGFKTSSGDYEFENQLKPKEPRWVSWKSQEDCYFQNNRWS
ncbi:hypothetical protein TNIN_290401 [Trichonephila inaurata madagascariensis]|uniref:Uncharacterized protein n=1 Tax=Trichonephila inaurata madagascariensis TaxID=2747483 RepID=A0A8X7BU41_9ARAC|nr:hypothetical protein TNIN_290401 [Trichonephila inaurata madagascariensis]